MLDNRRTTSLIGTIIAAAGYMLPLSALVGWLSEMAWQSDAPGLYNGLAVFAVGFVLLGTAFVHWRAQEKIAWNIAHAPQGVNVTVEPRERVIPNLGEMENDHFRPVAEAPAGTFETQAAVHNMPVRDIVDPPIPDFVTVTEMAALAYACLTENAPIDHRYWTGKDEHGKPRTFSDDQFRKLRQWMLAREFWRKVNDTKNSKIVMTKRGADWLRGIVQATPRPARTWRHIR